MITEEFYLQTEKGRIYIHIESNSGIWIENRGDILKSLSKHGEIIKE